MQAPTGDSGVQREPNSGQAAGSRAPRSTSPQRQPGRLERLAGVDVEAAQHVEGGELVAHAQARAGDDAEAAPVGVGGLEDLCP